MNENGSDFMDNLYDHELAKFNDKLSFFQNDFILKYFNILTLCQLICNAKLGRHIL